MEAVQFQPQVCSGAVMHERLAPVGHRFAYPLTMLRIPLSRWNSLGVPLLGVDRPGVFSLMSRDHGPRDGSDLLIWIRNLLKSHGIHSADGEVVLQTMPRILGYVFNPVSFWFCHDAAGGLRAVLAEVNNTFGERHNYLVTHPDQGLIRSDEVLSAAKVFHVSPFFPVGGEYLFRFQSRGEVHGISIHYFQDGALSLATRLSGRSRPLDGAAMGRWLLHFPFMTLGVLFRIHWQALRLAARRVPFFPKPQPPLQETSR